MMTSYGLVKYDLSEKDLEYSGLILDLKILEYYNHEMEIFSTKL